MQQKLSKIKLIKAEYLDFYRIQLVFSDGKKQTIDFGPFLENSSHPEIRKYLDLRTFKKFLVKQGNLMWGDFDLIFPIEDLYNNTLTSVRH